MRSVKFDVAQICLNGHLINDSYERKPDYNHDFCGICGSRTIIECPKCNKKIRGAGYSLSYMGSSPYAKEMGYGDDYVKSSAFKIQSYCLYCGSPFPWTEKKIQAAHDIARELDSLSTEEKTSLEKSIDDLLNESPETNLAVTRIKKIMPKIGKEAGNMLKDLLVDIASEAARKMLWPQQ
jgi:hypothetical protein